MGENIQDAGDLSDPPQQPGAFYAPASDGSNNFMPAPITPRFGGRKRLIIVVAAVLILAGVGLTAYTVFLKKEPLANNQPLVPSDQYAAPSFQPDQTTFTDQEIFAAVYSDYKTPASFFKDTLETGSNVRDSVYYITVAKGDKQAFYCTNDSSAAKQQVDQVIAEYKPSSKLSGRTIIDTSENEKFFEYKTLETTIPNSGINYYLRHRVYKCSYLSDLKREAYSRIDISTRRMYLGDFAKRPVTAEDANELVEFLWLSAFYNYNMGGAKVLSSFTEENAGMLLSFQTSALASSTGRRNSSAPRALAFAQLASRTAKSMQMFHEKIVHPLT